MERAWRRGTVGKLIHQHGAIRLAATEDVIRCLRRAGADQAADVLDRHVGATGRALDRIDECSRGMSALDLRDSDEFVRSIEDLGLLWRRELRSDTGCGLGWVASALGPDRSHLRSAHFVAKHAPLHPAGKRHWYQRIAPAVRLHSLYDLLRGFPTAESTVFSDAVLARRFDGRE